MPKVVLIPEIKLYLKVFAIMIDTDGPGTISTRKVANKNDNNEFNFLIYLDVFKLERFKLIY